MKKNQPQTGFPEEQDYGEVVEGPKCQHRPALVWEHEGVQFFAAARPMLTPENLRKADLALNLTGHALNWRSPVLSSGKWKILKFAWSF